MASNSLNGIGPRVGIRRAVPPPPQLQQQFGPSHHHACHTSLQATTLLALALTLCLLLGLSLGVFQHPGGQSTQILASQFLELSNPWDCQPSFSKPTLGQNLSLEPTWKGSVLESPHSDYNLLCIYLSHMPHGHPLYLLVSHFSSRLWGAPEAPTSATCSLALRFQPTDSASI